MSKMRFTPKTDWEIQDASAERLKDAGAMPADASAPKDAASLEPAPFEAAPEPPRRPALPGKADALRSRGADRAPKRAASLLSGRLPPQAVVIQGLD